MKSFLAPANFVCAPGDQTKLTQWLQTLDSTDTVAIVSIETFNSYIQEKKRNR
jgi:hypothetical protein